MNYFMLECYPEDDDATISAYPDLPSPQDNWMLGQHWTTTMPSPLIFEINEEDQGTMRPMMSTHFLLMTNDLVVAIESAGVTNVDSYPAIIVETHTGRKYDNYRAVNIIGHVVGIDEAASKSMPLAPELDVGIKIYDEIALDESKCRGHLLFRLAEKVSAIVVHKSVKETLLTKGFKRLQFIAPNDWAG